MGKASIMYGEMRCRYRALVWNPEVKRPLGRPRHKLEDNIKVDFQEVCGKGMDWIDLAQGGCCE
jgi:hypothetical protein